MNEPAVFIKAEQALKNVVDQIRDDQWDMVLPPDFVMRRTDHDVTLRELINYHAYLDAEGRRSRGAEER